MFGIEKKFEIILKQQVDKTWICSCPIFFIVVVAKTPRQAIVGVANKLKLVKNEKVLEVIL